MQKRDLTRLVRILGLLSSDNAGERASAAKAAHEFIKKHDLDWNDLLTAKPAQKTKEIGVDYLEAAESRIRQLQAHNQRLEKQVQRLKNKLDALNSES
jgi:peptidoglycan hydrolase CwlO-like protein